MSDQAQRARELLGRLTYYDTERESGISYDDDVEVLAQALADAEARGAAVEREAIEKLAIEYFAGLAASHSWMPLSEFIQAIRARGGKP